jgi:hypothetical protein
LRISRRRRKTRGPARRTQAQPATDTRAEVPAFEKRLTIFNLDTLERSGRGAAIPGSFTIIMVGMK